MAQIKPQHWKKSCLILQVLRMLYRYIFQQDNFPTEAMKLYSSKYIDVLESTELEAKVKVTLTRF